MFTFVSEFRPTIVPNQAEGYIAYAPRSAFAAAEGSIVDNALPVGQNFLPSEALARGNECC